MSDADYLADEAEQRKRWERELRVGASVLADELIKGIPAIADDWAFPDDVIERLRLHIEHAIVDALLDD